MQDFAWLLARNFSSQRQIRDEVPQGERDGDIQAEREECPGRTGIPVWSAYNSLIGNPIEVTKVGTPPLLAAPAHEWPTLLTILMQAQNINTSVVGPGRKTVISLDVGLYQPAKKLQMARNDLQHLILRPGELHIVMAQLRTIGAFIEDSGLDMCWIEADIYGPATVKQILDGNHVKRGEVAHVVTLQALFALYQKAFFQSSQEDLKSIADLSQEVAEACTLASNVELKEANTKLLEAVENQDLLKKMAEFDATRDQHPLFKVTREYMRMVMEMLQFIRAVRTGDWKLHLQALQVFTKYFFAHDRLNYARMMPLYLAEMDSLSTTDPDVYAEFLSGNWIVNKNSSIPFCALGADHGLEHVNRSMKVSGGLVGITLNQIARTKFFLIAPEMANLAEQAKGMAGVASKIQTRHHHHTTAVLSREDKNVKALMDTIETFTNPFAEESLDLFNLVTKVVMPDKVKEDLCNQTAIGQTLFDTFVKERIQSEKVNIWSTMKKQKLCTWKSNAKKVKVSTKEKMIELREDRSLFARMMMVCRSRHDMDIKETIGLYEFALVPRSMFASDGSMLHCSSKSALMAILEKLPSRLPDEGINDGTTTDTAAPHLKVTIIDGMAELQCLDKPDWVKNCTQLADHFVETIEQKYGRNDEVRLIFDRYDITMSLKEATREKRQGGQDAVYYRITDSTNISKVSMKKLLSHTKTKMELTKYLAEKAMKYFRIQHGRRFVVAWGSECKATHKDVEDLESNQEEADTKIILHAVDATSDGATEIQIHSPDTDVFVLALRREPELCGNVSFVTGKGRNRRSIMLKPIVQALGEARTAALPAFHALSGADNTGCFSGHAKPLCWKAFLNVDEDVVREMAKLGTTLRPSDETMKAIEKFVCELYVPNTSLTTVKDLRWWLFRKKQAQSERLPPTQGALHQAVLRAHYQAMVWNNDVVANPDIPSPENYGWEKNDNRWLPVMTKLPPAPEAIIQLVKCGCTKQCASNRCQCRKNGLACTDLFACSDEEDEPCQNVFTEVVDDDEYNEE